MKIFMRKSYLLIPFILIAWNYVLAQDSPFYDAPFGGGGGYVGGWIVPKLDGINVQLENFGVPALPASGFYTSGGAGFIYLGFIKNLRVGGIGFGGSRISTANTQQSIINSQTLTEFKEAQYSLGGGGLTIEYTLPFVKNFGVSLGAILGAGSMKINLYRNYGNVSWKDYWTSSGSNSPSSFSSSLTNNFWLFTPTLNVDIPAYHLLAFRIGAGYQFTFGGSWTYDNNKDILNAPSDINGNSFYFQAGIFVGLFSY